MKETPSMARWEALLPIEDLVPGELRQVRAGGLHLVVARTASGDVHVLDNRCPHEGYPLSQGKLDGEALTCCWHNWKFDVRDGACTLGEESVRAFPSRVQDGVLEVDLAEPEPAAAIPRLVESLRTGLERRELGRLWRDGARLLQAGMTPGELLAEVARYDAEHAEDGTTHALPVAADCLRLARRLRGTEAMLAIAPALDMCAEANRRLPVRPAPKPLAPPPNVGDELRAAIEAEDGERAEGLVRGAFEAGHDAAEVEGWILRAMSDHFTDFGHQLIYLMKTHELWSAQGEALAAELYPALVHSLVIATREDTLPYMRPYAEFLAAVEPRLPEVFESRSSGASFEPERLRDALLDGTSGEALEELWSALEAGVPPPRIARAIVAAAAWRLLRYDARWERDDTVAENFLWATHRFTFASAVRQAVERFDEPDALRLLFQAVAFVHSGRAMDAAPEDRTPIECEHSDAAGVVEAMRAKRPAVAVARAAYLLGRPGGYEELREALEAFVLADPVVRPIAVAHVIKTTVAACDEWDALVSDGADRQVPLLAAIRTWSLPLVERRVQGAVRTSLQWVVEGKVPRKLTQ